MATCTHLAESVDRQPPTDLVCPACVTAGSRWVSLRMCLSCGEVGCCDSSPHRHAATHFEQTQHPVMRSIEPGQDWRWCYVDEVSG